PPVDALGGVVHLWLLHRYQHPRWHGRRRLRPAAGVPQPRRKHPDPTSNRGRLPMSAVIQIDNLVKDYGKVRALNGLDLAVGPGEVQRFPGPYRGRKTPTVRLLLGLLPSGSGRATVFGADPIRHAVELHRRLAYVPRDLELWPNLAGGEAIDIFSRLRGHADRSAVEHLASRFDLDLHKKGRTYSKGNRQKVALVAALVAEVDLLILDEPTAGLDPLMEAVFQE